MNSFTLAIYSHLNIDKNTPHIKYGKQKLNCTCLMCKNITHVHPNTSPEQRHRATHLSIISIFPHTLSFAIFYHAFQNHSGCLSTTL